MIEVRRDGQWAAVKEAGKKNLWTHPELPVKVEHVRYQLTIG